MTNHWIDIKNADVIFMIGSNAAENHPASFRWILKAIEERGAKLIVIDPRFTKSASLAHVYAPLRPGTDLAFLGGIINYALENNLIQKEYVLEYTNASYLVNTDFAFNDGLFSGYDAGKRKYGDRKTWTYQMDAKKIPKQDKTLKDPQCVYQLMKKHYSRYTPDNGREGHRLPEGELPEGRRGVLLDAQAGQGRDHHVRDGDHPAHGRNAERTRAGHTPAPHGQHGPGGRRHQRAARRIERAGIDGPRAPLPPRPRLHAVTERKGPPHPEGV